MSVNRYTNLQWNNPVNSSLFIPRPFAELDAVGRATQHRYDKREAEMLDIMGTKVNALPKDQEYTTEAKKQIESELGDWSNKDFSNPATQTSWNKRKREITQRFSPQGDLGVINNNYNSYSKYEKDIIEKAKDLGWSQDELRGHLKEAKYSFNTIDPEKNDYNYFEGKGVANYVDPNDWSSKALKDVASDTGITKLANYGSLNEVTQAFAHGELEHKDYSKIMNALSARAMGDKKLLASLEQEGNFQGQQGWSNFLKGQDPKTGDFIPNENTPFGNILRGISYGAAYQKEKMDYMQVKDNAALARLKHKINNPNPSASTSDTYVSNSDNIPSYMKDIINADGVVDPKLVEKSLNDKSTTEYVTINGDKTSIKNLPTGYKVVQHGDGETSISDVVTPDGKTLVINTGISSDLVKENIDKMGKFTGENIVRFGIDTKDKNGKEKTPYQKMNDVLAVVGANSVLANSGTNYTNFPHIEQGITEAGRGYSKNEATMFTNMQASNLDGSEAVDAQKFLTDKKIDPKSVKFSEYDFSSPGSKKWVGVDKKGNQVSFIMTSKDLNERKHFEGITIVNKNIKAYLEGKPVKYSLRKDTKDLQGNNTPAYNVGDASYDANGNKLQAIYEPKYRQFFITVNGQLPTESDENGNTLPMNYNEYREKVTNDWVSGKYGLVNKKDETYNVGNTEESDGE